MAIVAVAGDVATTTAIVLAASWPAHDDVLLVEADPAGGDLAAWFDMPVQPSLSNVVTRVVDGSWPEVERLTRVAPVGLRVLPAPAGVAEAERAVAESARTLTTTLATLRSPIVIADAGDLPAQFASHPFLSVASVVVAVHRQSTQSPRAAAARLQRFSEQLLAQHGAVPSLVAVVVGALPFGATEIAAFLHEAAGDLTVVVLPVDELAAATFGGRTGVSGRRLARLPLMKAGRELAHAVAETLAGDLADRWRASR